nr:PilZ domain-containing protein [Desulfobulbaceae bacterium]
MAKNSKTPGVWTTEENGYERTNSPEIIKRTLSVVMQKRRVLVLLAKGYQSGMTVFVSFDAETLTIDKPMDWPELKNVRVAFKDEAKVWNHFTVSIVKVGKDTVKTKFPTELFRLQRRAHFRIEVPSSSRVSFVRSSGPVTDVVLVNISAGGLMMCFAKGEGPEKIKDQEVITGIEIELHPLPGDEGADQKGVEALHISQGVCVRSFEEKDQQKFCVGVSFEPRPNEEMKLMQCIRQLELEELRKGVMLQ